MKKPFILFLSFCAALQGLKSQTISPEILTKKWNAFWIAADNSSGQDYGVYHFRKIFSLDEKPNSFIIHVSADNRYKLFVNGTMVSLGPARGDIPHWNFETVDIASHLQKGDNIIAALVWNFGEQKQVAQMSFRTAFILQGNSDKEKIINTNKSWKSTRDKSYSPLAPDLIYSYYAAGPGEKIDYNIYPFGWQNINYDDSNWQPAKELMNGLPKGAFDWTDGWMLVPRSIPQIELKQQRLQTVRIVSGIKLPADFPFKQSSFTIPAHTKISILLDQGFLTNAYPVLQFSKGKGAHISLSYAEALYINEGVAKNWKAQNKKGNRNEVEGKNFSGVKDELVADGKEGQQFISLSWRTYRYMQLQLETADDALTIDDLYGMFTGYPFEMKAKFNGDDKVLDTILEVGWRTARSCAMETYMDCPYYEQLQYVGDTRIQALVSLFNGGDDRLMRQAISAIDNSRMAEGVTLSRYPTNVVQVIPTFSLWWIGMLHDYFMYRDDPQFVKNFLPGERNVLSFFSKFQMADGSVKDAPYWEFTDWAEGNGWNAGVAPIGSDGCSAAIDFQLLLAYQTAADLEENLGMKEYAAVYKDKAARLMATIISKYWDNTKKFFSDTKEKKSFSQHVNALAILTGIVTGNDAQQFATKILSDTSLKQATVYFKYYVNQAITKAGLGNVYLDQLQIWKDNLAFGMTTWSEISDINEARSDCHAWGASPNIELYRIVLGIDAAARGFDKIKIEPHLGNLKRASGSIPHPKGTIAVEYVFQNGKWTADISIPENTSGSFVWKGTGYALKPGKNSFNDLP